MKQQTVQETHVVVPAILIKILIRLIYTNRNALIIKLNYYLKIHFMKTSYPLLLIFLFLFSSAIIAQNPEERLKELNISLPEVKQPVANFVKWRKAGNLVYLAGHGSSMKGTLGKELNVEQGYEAARETGISILATLRQACGSLENIKQFVMVRGMVNSAADFSDQPKVINGFSDLMVEVFGEAGKHARAAVGHVSLPSNIAVEIEVVVELKE